MEICNSMRGRKKEGRVVLGLAVDVVVKGNFLELSQMDDDIGSKLLSSGSKKSLKERENIVGGYYYYC